VGRHFSAGNFCNPESQKRRKWPIGSTMIHFWEEKCE
jgi:hypothetical protein